MMAFLFENDHPNNNFWHSLVNSFQEEKQTDDVEDEMGTHLLKIDCSQERLADTCEYYDALTLPEIQLYEDGELLLKETVDENTERKIEKIKAGEPMEVTVEYNWDISPSPMLIEPPGEEQQKEIDRSGTIVHDFDYTPTEVAREWAFHQ